MKQAYIHIAHHSKTKEVFFVKVTKYSQASTHTQCNNALIKSGHNDFTLISYPFMLKELHTKPFKGLVGFKISDELNTREFLKEFISDRGLGLKNQS